MIQDCITAIEHHHPEHQCGDRATASEEPTRNAPHVTNEEGEVHSLSQRRTPTQRTGAVAKASLSVYNA